MRICRRLLPLSVLLAALVVFAGFQSGPRPAVADSFATVQGCTPASGAYSCTLTLTMGIGPGGVWEATPSDSTAGITSCDGTNAGAICTASVGSAIFVCKAGCPPNSTYTDMVSGSAAQAGAQYFTVLNPGGTPPVNANAPTNTTQTQPTYTAPSTTQTTYTQPVPGSIRVSLPTTTAIASPSYQTLVTTTSGVGGGQCVGGSIPTNLGCTALGVGGYGVGSYGFGGYGLGGFGGSCFGQLYGCGTSFNVGGGCGFFTGLGNGGCNNFGFNNFGFNNGGFNNCGNFGLNNCNGFNNGGFNNCGNFGFNNCNGFNNRFGFSGGFNGLNNANCTTLFGPNCTNVPTCPAGQQYRFFLQRCA